MLLVVERRQSRRLPGAVRSERQRAAASGSEQSNRGNDASARFSSARRARDFRRSQLIVSTRLQSRCWERTCT